jgi:hypothetical protein
LWPTHWLSHPAGPFTYADAEYCSTGVQTR